MRTRPARKQPNQLIEWTIANSKLGTSKVDWANWILVDTCWYQAITQTVMVSIVFVWRSVALSKFKRERSTIDRQRTSLNGLFKLKRKANWSVRLGSFWNSNLWFGIWLWFTNIMNSFRRVRNCLENLELLASVLLDCILFASSVSGSVFKKFMWFGHVQMTEQYRVCTTETALRSETIFVTNLIAQNGFVNSTMSNNDQKIIESGPNFCIPKFGVHRFFSDHRLNLASGLPAVLLCQTNFA